VLIHPAVILFSTFVVQVEISAIVEEGVFFLRSVNCGPFLFISVLQIILKVSEFSSFFALWCVERAAIAKIFGHIYK